ncbi:hypothetical protein GE09DRAFT_1113810 [Coniochaeta sp. 2T2.1]|nr:hypothetical protein GE09DRAFT_1113810 [Coniochaeta sp. 2T2.1]
MCVFKVGCLSAIRAFAADVLSLPSHAWLETWERGRDEKVGVGQGQEGLQQTGKKAGMLLEKERCHGIRWTTGRQGVWAMRASRGLQRHLGDGVRRLDGPKKGTRGAQSIRPRTTPGSSSLAIVWKKCENVSRGENREEARIVSLSLGQTLA